MKKLFALMIAAILLCTSLSGCNLANKNDAEQTDLVSFEDNTTETEKEVIRYTYRVAYKDIEFASETTKESWREPLLKLFRNEATRGRGEEWGEWGEYVFPYPDQPGLIPGWYIGLFDINVDGVPELLIDMGGGSAGNSFYEVYDIQSGENIGSLDGGQEDSWCVYLDTNMGDFEAIGQFEWRCGWAGKERFINKADITHTLDGIEKYVYETTYLRADYRIDAAAVDLTQEEIENGIHGAWEEIYTGVSFRVNGSDASIESYFGEFDCFMQTYIRIPETALKLIHRSDYSTPEEIVEALLSTTQQYIIVADSGE